MIASNMNELERMLRKEIQEAMRETSGDMFRDMYGETQVFYSQGHPKMYERTGTLGTTPRVTKTVSSGDEVSFDAYLDQKYVYATGDNPTMGQVLDLANYGIPWTTHGGATARATLGKKGFWERAEEKMEKTLDNNMSKHFDNISGAHS